VRRLATPGVHIFRGDGSREKNKKTGNDHRYPDVDMQKSWFSKNERKRLANVFDEALFDDARQGLPVGTKTF